MIPLLIAIPALAALAAVLMKNHLARRRLVAGTAVLHLCLTLASKDGGGGIDGWLGMDSIGFVFLGITSVLFLAAAVYALGYLATEQEKHPPRPDFVESKTVFANMPEAIFTACLLLFLSTLTLACAAQNFGLLWVAIEATTLATTPLIYYHRHHRSLEAAWKYLLVSSVGIALALLGTMFLAVSAMRPDSVEVSMSLADFLKAAPHLNPMWLKGAFIFLLIGYGTKMGLAPMHAWLPDAHSESPSIVSALLSGAQLNCAFLGIARGLQVCAAAGQGPFARELLVWFGIVSMAMAAAFILSQTDYKRMLAYSSVEHMGILALGVGLGGAGPFGAMLHAVNHSLAKGMLFLLAGNILAIYKTKSTHEVTGILKISPFNGALWLAGLFAIAGSPPFGLFVSEITILRTALDGGRTAVAALYLILLVLVFIGMASPMLAMAGGSPGKVHSEPRSLATLIPVATLAGLALLLGLWLPAPLLQTLHSAGRLLGGS